MTILEGGSSSRGFLGLAAGFGFGAAASCFLPPFSFFLGCSFFSFFFGVNLIGVLHSSKEPMTCLSPVHTIGNQIDEAIRLHRNANKQEAREITVEMLQKCGIPEPDRRADAYPHQLSGGMRQRTDT